MVEAISYMKEICEDYIGHKTVMIRETWVPSKKLAFNTYQDNLNVYRQDKPGYGKPAIGGHSRSRNLHRLNAEMVKFVINNLKEREIAYQTYAEKLLAEAVISHITLDVGYVAELMQKLEDKRQQQQQQDIALAQHDAVSDTDDNIYSRYPITRVSLLHNTVYLSKELADKAAKTEIEANTGLSNPNYVLEKEEVQ